MRDVGTIVWVVFILIGVASSMVKSVRRQAATAGAAAPPGPRPVQAGVPLPDLAQPLAPAPRPAAPSPERRRSAPPPAAAAPASTAASPRARLFGGRSDLVRAVIAVEVLGKPRALGDEYTIR